MADKSVELTGTKLAECVAKLIPIVNHLHDTGATITCRELAALVGLPSVHGYRRQIGTVMYAARAIDDFSEHRELRSRKMDMVVGANGKPLIGAGRLPKIVIGEAE